MEQEKLFCLLLSIQEKLRQDLAEDPAYGRTLDLERLQSILDSYRKYIRQGRDLFDQLNGWMQRLERNAEAPSAEDVKKEYPMDPVYHLAVADQERELCRLYPSRFGPE